MKKMKTTFKTSWILLLFLLTSFASAQCNPAVSLSSTTAIATCQGSATTITLTSTPANLPDGTYEVNYTISTNNLISTAVMVVSAGMGSFISIPLPNAGSQPLTINSLLRGTCTTTLNSGNTSTITVSASSQGGQVGSNNAKICLNASTGNMLLTGQLGTVKRWEKKLITQTVWTPIVNTATAYSENPSVAGTWQYRAVVANGTCAEAASVAFSVEVNPAMTITLQNPNMTLCAGATSATLNYSASTGSHAVKIDFISGLPNITYLTISAGGGTIPIPIDSAPAGTYSGTLTLITNYPACTGPTIYPLTITIGAGSVGGTVNGAQTICAGSKPANLTLVGNTGSVVKWQKSNFQTFSSFTDIASTSTTLTGSVIGEVSNNTYFRAVVQSGGCAEAYSTPALVSVGPTTAYNGLFWTNGDPNSTVSAIVASNYTTTGSIIACNCTINPGATLTVAAATSFTTNNIINNGAMVVKSGANFLQTSSTSTYSGTGTFSVEKDVTDMNNLISSGKRDFVYWSSPVAAQTVQGFSPGTPNNQRLQYTEATDYFIITPDASFLPAKGYALGAETTLTDGYNKTYTFSGIPNNGDFSVNLTKSGQGYNLVGNPYPSNIDFDVLYTNNSTVIDNTVWRWTNSTYTAGQQGANYNGNNYVAYNGTGGQTPSTTRQIAVGQGFFVQKTNAGSANLNFTNTALRVAGTALFVQKNTTPENRFWLTLTSPTGISNTQLIGYVLGATNGFDVNYDSEALDLSSDLFYAPLLGKKLVVQGKDAAFQISDKVKLGANFFANGNYTIAIEQPEGIFATNQTVYLKDNVLNTYTDLKAGAYSFSANAGLTENRFEIVYEQSVLATAETLSADDLVVYKKGEHFYVKSSNALDRIEILDASGRVIKTVKASPGITEIVLSTFNKGVYLLQIKLKDGSLQTRKIMK